MTNVHDIPTTDGQGKRLRVLVACEYSATVRDAFRARGHNAWSCDLLPTEGDATWHIRDSVLHLFSRDPWWDLIIAHPPCTYLANSGAKHLYAGMSKNNGINPDRWIAMEEAAEFYVNMLDGPAPHIAVENPIMHGPGKREVERYWARRYPTQHLPPVHYIQPHQFGHGETKATGFRLRGLPPLKSTNQVEGREQRVFKMAPSPDRWKERSRTYQGVADAMAQQWGDYVAQVQA